MAATFSPNTSAVQVSRGSPQSCSLATLMQLTELETPALVLDRGKLDRNLERMNAHIRSLGGALRPHVKTVKSIDVVRRALRDTPGGITVSTPQEAEYFLTHGIRDIVYAVGIAPSKFAHVFSLLRNGAQLKVIADSIDAVRQLAEAARAANMRVPVLIELDVDDHRSGVSPDSQLLLELGQVLTSTSGVTLAGVLTHAGDSYSCRGAEALTRFAERERAGAVGAAQRLRSVGHEVPIVSVGSTPTGTFTRDLSGVTEVRVGVYMFQDLVMAGIGVCGIDDIAVSVLVSVIGHQGERGWIITDGGWTFFSRDRGTATHSGDP